MSAKQRNVANRDSVQPRSIPGLEHQLDVMGGGSVAHLRMLVSGKLMMRAAKPWRSARTGHSAPLPALDSTSVGSG